MTTPDIRSDNEPVSVADGQLLLALVGLMLEHQEIIVFEAGGIRVQDTDRSIYIPKHPLSGGVQTAKGEV